MKNTAGEIRALITLLGDEDGNVREIARERLLQIGEEAEEYLREATVSDLEAKIRIQASHVLEKIRRDDLIGSFYVLGLLEDDQIDLEHAAFLLARVGCSDLQISLHQHELDRLAECVRPRLAGYHLRRDGRLIVEAVNRVLFAEEGFCGNVDEYYDPDNSYLNRVLERRTGIPVSLSVLYLLVARRLQLPLRGINMPVHFICQYHTPEESFYVDPFNNGRIITRAECIVLLQGSGYTFQEHYLQPAQPRTILARMVRNLILIYYQREQMEKATLLDRILKMLRTTEQQ